MNSTSLAREGDAAAISSIAAAAAIQPIKEISEKGGDPTQLQALWKVVQAHPHSEIWGVTLEDPDTHVPSQ